MALPALTQGTVCKFGTLYLNGARQARPTNPVYEGDIPAYASGNIEIRDTDSSDAYKIQWIPVSVDGKWLLVADRSILNWASWNTLNAQGLVYGKTMKIDGVTVKARLLTGGTRDRVTGSSGNNGGTPANEWDDIVQNGGGYANLPTPTAADKDEGDHSGSAHNQKWNWYTVCSDVQEASALDPTDAVIRGKSTSRYIAFVNKNVPHPQVGYRPVLEVLNSDPIVSDLGGNLGNKAASFTVAYTVNEPDGEKFSLLEKVDGTTARSLTNQDSGSFTLDLSGVWGSLSKGGHTITVTATDPNGNAATVTATFTKANIAPPAPTYQLANGNRIPVGGYIEFTPGADFDGDTQTATLQHADNSSFASAASVTSGLQKWNGSAWADVANIPASAAGAKHRLPYGGLALNTTRYARVRVNDGTSTATGATRALKVGETLQAQTPAYAAATMPTKVKIALDAVLSTGASVGQILVCNNANDASPTWEDATAAYLGGDPAYSFTNTTKTDASWAVAAQVLINAGTATGEVSLAKIGLGVL